MISRDRVTDRISFSLLRLELKRAGKPLVIIAIGFVVAILAGRYILQGISGGIGSTRTLKFQVADATGVVPGRGQVRFDGIQAGEIQKADLSGGKAVLTVSVAKKFGPIYKNAQAELRPNTALNDMYLDVVNPGTKRAGLATKSYVVPVSDTTSPTNLATVLNTFTPNVQEQLNTILDQAGNGIAGHGQDLRQAFIELAPFIQVAGDISHQLAVRATLTKQLVHNASILSSTLASRSTSLRSLVTNGTTTLNALNTEQGNALHQAIEVFPAAFHNVDTLFEGYFNIRNETNQALTDLTPVASEIPTGLTNLKKLATAATPAVTKLQTPVKRLVPLAKSLAPFSAKLQGSLTQLQPQITDVNDVTNALAPCMQAFDEFFNWDDSMAKWHDEAGNMVRGNVHVGFYTIPGGNQSNYTYDYQCAGGTPPLGQTPTPKYNGPAPTP